MDTLLLCACVMPLLFAGCQNVKDVSDGIGKSSAGVASSVGEAAQGAVESAGGIAGGTGAVAAGMAGGAGNAAFGATHAAGSAAMDITTEMGNASYEAASGVGAAANNVRLGAIDTFGVRETTSTQRFYVDELKPVYVIPAQKNEAAEQPRDSSI
jgi:hypothetical protein